MNNEELNRIIDEELEAFLREEDLDEKKGSKRQRKKKAKKKAKKKDACYHKVKARYKVWPSAYASGALVQCRKKGAKNWGNKSKKKNESLHEEDSPLQKVKDALNKEGGAAGLSKIAELSGLSEKEIKDVISSSEDIKVHDEGDVVELSGLEEGKAMHTAVKLIIAEEETLEEKKNSKCTKVTKKASSTRKGKKWMKCVKSDSGGYKRIHWGQAGVRVTGKSGNTKRKKSFKKRHNCSKAKSNTPQGQACKDWAE